MTSGSHRLDERADLFVYLTIGERRDVDQHGVERTGLLGNRNRLHDLRRKAVRRAHGRGEPFAAPQPGGNFHRGAIEESVAGGVSQ